MRKRPMNPAKSWYDRDTESVSGYESVNRELKWMEELKYQSHQSVLNPKSIRTVKMARDGHPMIWDVCLLEWVLQRGKKHGTEMVAFLQKYSYLFTWVMRHPPQNRYLQNEQNIKQKDIAQICGHESHKFLSLYFGLCSHACPICPPSLINEAHLKSGRP